MNAQVDAQVERQIIALYWRSLPHEFAKRSVHQCELMKGAQQNYEQLAYTSHRLLDQVSPHDFHLQLISEQLIPEPLIPELIVSVTVLCLHVTVFVSLLEG